MKYLWVDLQLPRQSFYTNELNAYGSNWLVNKSHFVFDEGAA